VKTITTVTSKDGTQIAFDLYGEGPAVILVGGALSVRASSIPMFRELVDLLSDRVTVYNYDRRGRGDSGDTPPYAVRREVEDIKALVDHAGGPAYLYGLSSGAALALEAGNQLPGKVKKLALYEPPFIVDDSWPPLPEDYIERLDKMIAEGRRGDAVALFMKVVGVPEEYIPMMRQDPSWAEMEAVAHTLAYDGAILKDNASGKPLEPHQWDSATMPTLVIVGGESEPFFRTGAQALVDLLPNAKLYVLEGQAHDVSSEALAPVLAEFFAG
jgi:pimeloyl-ACP methyl ester carboxylesterase